MFVLMARPDCQYMLPAATIGILRSRMASEDTCKVWMTRTRLRAVSLNVQKKIKIPVDVAAILTPEFLVYSFSIHPFPFADKGLSLDFEIIFT